MKQLKLSVGGATLCVLVYLLIQFVIPDDAQSLGIPPTIPTYGTGGEVGGPIELSERASAALGVATMALKHNEFEVVVRTLNVPESYDEKGELLHRIIRSEVGRLGDSGGEAAGSQISKYREWIEDLESARERVKCLTALADLRTLAPKPEEPPTKRDLLYEAAALVGSISGPTMVARWRQPVIAFLVAACGFVATTFFGTLIGEVTKAKVKESSNIAESKPNRG